MGRLRSLHRKGEQVTPTMRGIRLETLTSDARAFDERCHRWMAKWGQDRCRWVPNNDLAMRDVSVCVDPWAEDPPRHDVCWTRPVRYRWGPPATTCLVAPKYSKRAAQAEADRRAGRVCIGSLYLPPGPLRRPLSLFLRGFLTIDGGMSFFLCARSYLLRL